MADAKSVKLQRFDGFLMSTFDTRWTHGLGVVASLMLMALLVLTLSGRYVRQLPNFEFENPITLHNGELPLCSGYVKFLVPGKAVDSRVSGVNSIYIN